MHPSVLKLIQNLPLTAEEVEALRTHLASLPADAKPRSLRMLEMSDLVAKVKKSKPWLYTGMKDPQINFPKPVRIGKSSRWIEEEVDRWLEARAAARETSAPEQRKQGRYAEVAA